jgi:hypothetical protein
VFTSVELIEFTPEGREDITKATEYLETIIEDDGGVVQVEAARIPDRDRLLKTLNDHGYEARPVNEVRIVVHHATSNTSREVYRDVENDVMALGSPFVPMKHDGVIYLRPPIG